MHSDAAESVDHDHNGLTATHLSVGYRGRVGSRVVLRDLDLTCRPGELVCLLGANGTGKSTLMRTLGGLQTPMGGTVTLGGRAVHAMSRIERARRLALVLTTRVSVARLSGHELVQAGRASYAGWAGNLNEEDHRVVLWALELTRSDALAAFAHPGYAFDAWAGGFQVRVRARGRARVRAPRTTLAAIWTNRTLERFGYEIMPDGNTELTVDLIGDDAHPRWQLTAARRTSTFDSLSALAAALGASEATSR